MNYEINTALEQLEKSLNDVKSAQEQVVSVTNSYSQLQVEIKKYADELSVISSSLSSVITSVKGSHQQGLESLASAWENLRTQSETIMADVNKLLSTSADNFKKETEQASSTLSSQVTKLESSVEKLSNLHTKVEDAATSISKLKEEITKLQTDLTSSQKAQDEAIANINKTANSISSQLSTTDTTVNGISNVLATHGNSLADVKQSLNSLSTSLTQLDTTVQNLQNTLVQRINNAQSQIGQQVVSLAQDVSTRHDELKNKVSTLQTLLIVQLVISVAAIIIMFVLK